MENVNRKKQKIHRLAKNFFSLETKITIIATVVIENRPLINIFQEKALLLWERILRISGSLSLF